MKKIILFSVAFFIFFPVQPSYSAGNTSRHSSKNAQQREWPPELLKWMSERYDSKILLGLEWKGMDKARLFRTINKMQWASARNKELFSARKSGGKIRRRGRISYKRIDINPNLIQKTLNPNLELGNNNYGIKMTAIGGRMGWNAGYLKVSETDASILNNQYSVNADIVFASAVFSPPAEKFSPYLYLGPALVKYDYSETTTSLVLLAAPPWFTTTTSSVNKKDSSFTWILGLGLSYTIKNSNFGFFAEYQHIPEVDNFRGVDNIALGISLSL